MTYREPSCIQTFQEHTDYIRSVCFHPTRSVLCTVSDDKRIIFWSLEDRSNPVKMKEFTGHTGYIWSVDISMDGERIASASSDRTIQLWDFDRGNVATLEGHTENVKSVRFNPNGTLLVSAGEDTSLRLWDVSRGESILEIPNANGSNVYAGSFMNGDRGIISCGEDNTVKLWDLRMEEKRVHTFSDHSNTVYTVVHHQDTFCVASGSADNKVFLNDIRMLKLLYTYNDHTGTVRKLDFHPSGNYLISGAWDHSVKVFDLMNTKVLFTLNKHEKDINIVRFSSDGSLFASGGDDSIVHLWETNFFTYKPPQFFQHPVQVVESKPITTKSDSKKVEKKVEARIENADLSFWNERKWSERHVERITSAWEKFSNTEIALSNKKIMLPETFLSTTNLEELLRACESGDLSLDISSSEICQLMLMSPEIHTPILERINLVDYYTFFTILGAKDPLELILSHLEEKSFKEIYLLLQEVAKKHENETIKSWFTPNQKRAETYTESLFETSFCLACFIQLKKKLSELDTDPSLFMVDMFVGMMRGHLMMWDQDQYPLRFWKHKDLRDAKNFDLVSLLDHLFTTNHKQRSTNLLVLVSSEGREFQAHKEVLCAGFLDRFAAQALLLDQERVVVDIESSVLEILVTLAYQEPKKVISQLDDSRIELLLDLISQTHKHDDLMVLHECIIRLEQVCRPVSSKEEVLRIVQKKGHLLSEEVCQWVVPNLIRYSQQAVSAQEILKISRKANRDFSVTNRITTISKELKRENEDVVELKKLVGIQKSEMEEMKQRMMKLESLLREKLDGDI